MKKYKIKWIKWWESESFEKGLSFTGWIKSVQEIKLTAYVIGLPILDNNKAPFGFLVIECSIRPTGDKKEDLHRAEVAKEEATKIALRAKNYFQRNRKWGKYLKYVNPNGNINLK